MFSYSETVKPRIVSTLHHQLHNIPYLLLLTPLSLIMTSSLSSPKTSNHVTCPTSPCPRQAPQALQPHLPFTYLHHPGYLCYLVCPSQPFALPSLMQCFSQWSRSRYYLTIQWFECGFFVNIGRIKDKEMLNKE